MSYKSETRCSVAGCKSKYLPKISKESVRFFRFPQDKLVEKEWVRRCSREKTFVCTNKRVCSKHFQPQDYEDELKARLLKLQPKKLKKDAIPNLFLDPKFDKNTKKAQERTSPRKLQSKVSPKSRAKKKDISDVKLVRESENTTLEEILGPALVPSSSTICCVKSCPNSYILNGCIQLFQFPMNTQLNKAWQKACGININDSEEYVHHVCIAHFKTDDLISITGTSQFILTSQSTPTLNLPIPEKIDSTPNQTRANAKRKLPQTNTLPMPKLTKIEVNTKDQLRELQNSNAQLEENLNLSKIKLRNIQKSISDANNSCDEIFKQTQMVQKQIATLQNSTSLNAEEGLKKVFSDKQISCIKNSATGKMHFSKDDIAIGYTILSLSNKDCYKYLKETMGIPLPSWNTVRNKHSGAKCE